MPSLLPPVAKAPASAAAPPQKPINAFGTNLTPPSPISYSMSGNLGNISNVISQVNAGQNQANAANNQRYAQQLGVLTNASQGQLGNLGSALGSVQQGYYNAAASLGSSLGNDQTVYNNEALRATQDAQKASSNASQSAVSRGLTNTTIMDSMQDQVQRAKNDAMTNIASAKAQSDNTVYQNLANIYANGGNAAAGVQSQLANAYAQGGGAIANAIGARNDVGPNIGDYAGLIQGASAAQNSNQKSVIQTTNPVPINANQSSMFSGSGGGGLSGGGGISGGIASSAGGGGFNSGGGGTTTTGPISSNAGGGGGGGTSTSFPNGVPDPSTFPGGTGDPTQPPNSSAGNTPASPNNEPNDGQATGGNGVQPGGQYSYGADGWIGYKNPDGTWVVINPGNKGGVV